ncbi:MAG: Plastocyanin [Stenotrophomonas maltophilia]|nr:MAG: Plastocyanin [Stenotrophomonas maltophilia]
MIRRLPLFFALLGACLSLPALAHADTDAALDFGRPAAAAQATRTVEVTLGDLYFEPRSLQVKPGETVRFVLVNHGKLLHEFNLGSPAMHARHQQEMQQMQAAGMLGSTGMQHMDHGMPMQHDDPNSVLVEPGQRAELTWTFGRAMQLQFACNVPGHYQAGMVGTLDVAP